MTAKTYDVITPKEYQVQKDGKTETKTAWNRVGVAWKAKTPDTLSFELFLLPGNRYSISLKERIPDPEQSANKLDEIEF